MGDAGDYLMAAWVRRPTSTAPYDAYGLSSTFSVGNYPAKALAVATSLTTATAGTPVAITARASGGPGRLEYKFYRFSSATNSWYLVQDYSWDNTFAWVPSTSERGSHTFQVWVRRAGTTAAYESFANLAGSITIN